MRRLLVFGLVFMLAPLWGQVGSFEPSPEMIAEHRAKVFELARAYVMETFHIRPEEEGFFNPVRFNSMGVWGDFEVRLKELGGDRFEAQGWVIPVGAGEQKLGWSVIIKYRLVDPEAWRYQRVDREYVNEPEIHGWKFGDYQSSPYKPEYTHDYEYSLLSR